MASRIVEAWNVLRGHTAPVTAKRSSVYFDTNRRVLNSPNVEVRRSLEELVNASRLACNTNPYASKYLELVSVNVCGAEGLQIAPRVKDASGSLDLQVNTAIKAAWLTWGEQASYDGRFSFRELEQMLIKDLARDGEALVQIIRGKSVGKFGIALKRIDPTLLDVRYNQSLGDKGSINMGVETDSKGTPVAYHIFTRAIDATTQGPRERVRIPASDIIHVLDSADDVARGTPWLAPVLRTLGLLDQYQHAHLKACQIASNATLKMIDTGTTPPPNEAADVGVNNAGDTATAYTPPPSIDLTTNQIIDVAAGKDLVPFDWKYPQQGFDVAVKTYLQQIASGMMISYTSLTTDGSSESFSTVRFSSQSEKDYWKQIQTMFSTRLHKRVYAAWLEAATLSGALSLPGDWEAYTAVDFRPRGFISQDPRKDAAANQAALDNGLITRTQLAAEGGSDYEENIRILAAEQAFAKQHGVTLPGMTNEA